MHRAEAGKWTWGGGRVSLVLIDPACSADALFVHCAQVPSLDDSLRVVICDAARPLATRLWESWLPTSAAVEGSDGDVASARISVADVLQAGPWWFRGFKNPHL